MHPQNARAVWIVAPRQVAIRSEPVPPLGPGQVCIAAIASAISHGTEMLVYRGLVDPELPLDLPTFAGGFAFPIKYGYACVGQVLAVGPGVNEFAPGDQVFALHPHQSLFLAPVEFVTRLPPELDPALGVFFANTETALNVAHDAAPRLGETTLVFGQGVVGLLVTQTLRLAGATRVIVVEPDAARRALALALGADAALAPSPTLVDDVRAHNQGRLADLAVEVSGSPAALQAAIDTVLDEATVVVASWYGRKPVTLDLGGRFHRGRIRLRSSQVGRLAPETLPRWDHARRAATVAALLPRLQLAPLQGPRLPLERAAEAYGLVDAGAAVQVVLTYDGVMG